MIVMGLRLNLGCGRSSMEDYINVDMTAFPGIDLIFNFDIFPYPFKENTFEEIFLDNVLEHLDNIPKVMNELHRISIPNGRIIIKVPYYNSYGAYNDITHKHYFNSHSLAAFYTHEHRSNYGKPNYELIELELVPTRLGKLIPSSKVLLNLSYIFGQLIAMVVFRLRVIKGI